MKKISVVTPCYNEEQNVEVIYKEVRDVFARLSDYSYEHIFIDNNSNDRTVEILKSIAKVDRNVKVIVNTRNFGHIRSPYYGLLQASGQAVILIVCDLQDPPPMIVDFLRKWEEGYKIVIGVKSQSQESPLFFSVRKLYYNIIRMLSEIELAAADDRGFPPQMGGRV